MADQNASSSPSSSPFDIPSDASLGDVVKYLQSLQEAFAAHTHDGVNSQQLISLALQALTSITIAIRKGSFDDPTPGLWIGLVNNVVKLSLGDGTFENSLIWDGKTLSVSNVSVKKGFTAHTAVIAGNPLILGSGISGYLTSNNRVGTNETGLGDVLNGTDNRTNVAQTFTTGGETTAIRAVLLKLRTDNFASGYATQIDIYACDVNHKPAGSSLGTTSSIITQNATGEYTFTFTSPVPVSPSTEYALVATSISTSNGGQTWAKTNTAGYGGGYVVQKANTSSTWGSPDNTISLWYQLWEVFTAAGEVQPSDTTQTIFPGDNYDLANNFLGFAAGPGAAGATVFVELSGLDQNQSGLTIGKTYFLSGSGGALATSAGAVSVRVGWSVSTTSIFIHPDNYPS